MYLDTKGLVAQWREGLLAKAVLEGKTRGYKNHPQLNRFKVTPLPVAELNQYLHHILTESKVRGYKFDASKLGPLLGPTEIPVTSGQMEYEYQHLLKKVRARDVKWYEHLISLPKGLVNPVFKIVDGPIESWEIISQPGTKT